ncbi:DUF4292 domain-containing protein, partial [Seonamhaeicola marinus]
MQLRTQIVIVLIMAMLFSCKSAKTVSGGEANYNLSAKQLIKAHYKQHADYKTLK